MSYDHIQLSPNPALFKSGKLIALLLRPSRSCVSRDIWNRLAEVPRCCLSLKSQWQPQTGPVRPLEGSWILPVRCAHINTPPVLAGNQFSSRVLPPLGNVPAFGICPHLPCFAHKTKKSFCFSRHLSHFCLKKILLEFSLTRHADVFLFLFSMSLKPPSFACLLFSLQFLLHFPHLVLAGVLIPTPFTPFDYRKEVASVT